MKEGEEQVVSALVRRVFSAHVARTCLPEGVDHFERESSAEAIELRNRSGSIFVVAESEGGVVGAVESLSNNHVTMLFVDDEYQGSGIGKRLVEQLLDEVRKTDKDCEQITVSAAVNVVGFYMKCGFEIVGTKTEKGGFVFVPMRRIL